MAMLNGQEYKKKIKGRYKRANTSIHALTLIPLSEREARVVPLALAWDALDKWDVAALREHAQACRAARCEAMAQRAERQIKIVKRMKERESR